MKHILSKGALLGTKLSYMSIFTITLFAFFSLKSLGQAGSTSITFVPSSPISSGIEPGTTITIPFNFSYNRAPDCDACFMSSVSFDLQYDLINTVTNAITTITPNQTGLTVTAGCNFNGNQPASISGSSSFKIPCTIPSADYWLNISIRNFVPNAACNNFSAQATDISNNNVQFCSTFQGNVNNFTFSKVMKFTSVTALAISPTATPSTLLPSGSPSTLTSSLNANASGSASFTYNWSPSTGLSSTTSATPTATPQLTTTYSITGTTALGCVLNNSVSVTVLYPQCNITTINIPNGATASSVFGAGGQPAVGQNYSIAGTFTIDQNTTFNANNIQMASSTSNIQVPTGKILTLSQKTHIYSCNSMWDGIYVQSGGKIICSTNTFIEDASNAINIAQGAVISTIDQTIFNRNKTAVNLTSNTAASSPVVITSSFFTSRDISTNAIASSNLTASQYWANIVAGTYPTANMKSPNTISKGVFGIMATDVNTLTVGSATSSGIFNGFDEIKCGVYLTRSNATVYNNKFQKILDPTSVSCFPGPCFNYLGYGVIASGTSAGTYSLTIGNTGANQLNTFTDVYQAINVTDYKTVNVFNNQIDNSSTAQSPTIGYGNVGILVKPASNNTIDLESNTINNCAIAVWVNRNSTSSISTNVLKVDNNIISANSTGYCTTGIYFIDLLAGTSVTPTTSEITGNVITESGTGVGLTNVKKIINVVTNSITCRYSTSANTNGIKAEGCQNVNISNNHTKYNNVLGTAYTSGSNILSYGIYLQNSTNMLVQCNQIDDAARSMVFSGTCTSPLTTNSSPTIGITTNTMSRAQDGFVLLSSGTIGTQGSSTVASNNYWDMSTIFANSQTTCDNSTALSSVLYVTNATGGATATRPLTNSFGGAGFAYAWTTSLISSTGTPAACGTVPMLGAFSGTSHRSAILSNYTEELKIMVKDTNELPVYNDASHWQRKRFVYNEIKNNVSLTNDSVLNNFYLINSNSAIGKFSAIEDEIVFGDYTLANNVNSAIITNNTLEQNEKTVNDLILRKLIDPNYVYIADDTSILYSIAVQCPIAGGNAVYQARNLLMSIENKVIEFKDNCNEKSKRYNVKNAVEINQTFKLSPNPNNGNMVLEYSLAENEKGLIAIYDLKGELITQYALNNSVNKLAINREELNNGIYFYKIIINNKIVKTDKIVIIK
jgi:hypothetical protein